jgi:hypothetical protein
VRSIQVGDGIGGPLEWENPINWGYIPGDCRNFILERAGYADRVGVACRRLLYCFLISGKGQVMDYHNITEKDRDQLSLQQLLLDEHVLALRLYQFTGEDKKHEDVFVRINGYLCAFLANIGLRIDIDALRQKHRCLYENAMNQTSHTIVCGSLEANLFRSQHTIVLEVKKITDETRENFIGIIDPFKLKSLIVVVGSRRIIFKDTTVMWIVQSQYDSEAFYICLRNTRDRTQMTNKGQQPYKVTTAKWTTKQQECFIRNCEIAEKRFEKKYLGEDVDREDMVTDGLV